MTTRPPGPPPGPPTRPKDYPTMSDPWRCTDGGAHELNYRRDGAFYFCPKCQTKISKFALKEMTD